MSPNWIAVVVSGIVVVCIIAVALLESYLHNRRKR